MDLYIEEIDEQSSDLINFINKWEFDIVSIFPDFEPEESVFCTIYLLRINDLSSGLFIYQAKGEELHIDVDYLIPEFRNKGVGEEFLQKKVKDFKNEGFERIVSVTSHELHRKYLNTLGFINSKHSDRYELELI